eukprot:scaffold10995_cov112-Isochrysis_galbana.AAC.6
MLATAQNHIMESGQVRHELQCGASIADFCKCPPAGAVWALAYMKHCYLRLYCLQVKAYTVVKLQSFICNVIHNRKVQAVRSSAAAACSAPPPPSLLTTDPAFMRIGHHCTHLVAHHAHEHDHRPAAEVRSADRCRLACVRLPMPPTRKAHRSILSAGSTTPALHRIPSDL